jgi:flagellar hook-associated protein FlgK
MKTKILGLTLVLLFSAASTFGQSRIVLDQTINAVSFSSNKKVWGLEINGKTVLSEKYKTIGLQSGLFKVENIEGKWNVCDKAGAFKLKNWVKATGVKISSDFVLFENADGKMALTYDRATWTPVKATETTYDAMYKEVEAANAGKGTKIHGYETAAQEAERKYQTQPRVVRKNYKSYLMFRDVEINYADEVISLNDDFNAEGRWYFKARSGDVWGVVFVKKANPTDLKVSIRFRYTKIEPANNGWEMLNCHLPDGTVELRWYDGQTPEQKSIPE